MPEYQRAILLLLPSNAEEDSWTPRLPDTWEFVKRTTELTPELTLCSGSPLILHRSGYVYAADRFIPEGEDIDYETPSGVRLYRVGRGVLCLLGPALDEQWFSYDGVDWWELVPTVESELPWINRLELRLRRLVNRI